VRRYDLGAVGGDPTGGEVAPGERLGFTDATPLGDDGAVLYVAAAEASVDVYEDGPVAGSAVGVIAADGEARWALLVDDRGNDFLEKVEGVAFDGTGRPWVVVDQDDPDQPSELCELALDGVSGG
jgi:hypothetical protein